MLVHSSSSHPKTHSPKKGKIPKWSLPFYFQPNIKMPFHKFSRFYEGNSNGRNNFSSLLFEYSAVVISKIIAAKKNRRKKFSLESSQALMEYLFCHYSWRVSRGVDATTESRWIWYSRGNYTQWHGSRQR